MFIVFSMQKFVGVIENECFVPQEAIIRWVLGLS